MAEPTTVLTIEHIVQTPGICGGRPRIAGRRITVSEIVLWHERSRWTAEKIAQQFDLTLGQVYAALAYYHDHREAVEQEIAQDRERETRLRPGP